ncbi:MAG: nucleotidyltransferase domain-containing protein [Rhodocyclales bacterium]|nr:nucleotidyltransferase domain-containing protein [Rhodocyclales bacterium]
MARNAIPENKLIQSALACLKPELPSGARVIVFGSQADGSADAASDIDLLVVEPGNPDRVSEMARLAAILGRRLVPADVVVMSNESFSRQAEIPNTLAWRAVRQGIECELGV